ncbi:hypothetical protein RclHR1_01640001 [Rhizophagus clarus]|uniref:Uncharacterized protein n=1 Tax=Rhizophagus clarus TaxID=94130 RepID=A0A2Z6QUW5_9GLOM|nr:hypothetical protein RclHR1_01640001 [Rhizophagus clarus]GES95481.1 hypothetical protein GLOIN_2v1779527 [Rhizophagus clarus]
MSQKISTRGTSPYVQKIVLNSNGSRRVKRKPPKLCPDCKETNDCVKIISSKVNKIEETVNNFYKNLPKKNNYQFSTFNAKFTLNNVPCEVEYDLSKFSLDSLQKLVIFTTQNCDNSNENNQHPSSIYSKSSSPSTSSTSSD